MCARARKQHVRSGPTHRSAPTGVAKLICILLGLRVLGSCSGRGKPRPYKDTGHIGCPVGAHLCVRPCTKAACTQRADTSVGPYRGGKVDLYFDEVASVGFVQRSRQASTLQRYRTYRLPCRGAPVCAPVHESSMYAAGRHIGRPLQGLQTYFVFWWGCECFVRAAVEASLDPTKVPDRADAL